MKELLDFLNTLIDSCDLDKSESVDEEIEIEIDADDLPFADKCEPVDCDHCEHFDECYADDIYDDTEDDPPMWGIPDIDRVVFSGRATIVFWTDGTKTVVKAMQGERFERYAGFAAACMKKMFGSTSRAKAIMEECVVEQAQKKEKSKQNKVPVPDLTQAFNEVVANHESVQEAVNETFVRQ